MGQDKDASPAHTISIGALASRPSIKQVVVLVHFLYRLSNICSCAASHFRVAHERSKSQPFDTLLIQAHEMHRRVAEDKVPQLLI